MTYRTHDKTSYVLNRQRGHHGGEGDWAKNCLLVQIEIGKDDGLLTSQKQKQK